MTLLVLYDSLLVLYDSLLVLYDSLLVLYDSLLVLYDSLLVLYDSLLVLYDSLLVLYDSHCIQIELELQDTTQSLAFYGRHPSWKLQNFTAQANDIIISDTETFTELSISVRVARKGSYYYRLFVAPAAVCMFVIPVIHFLPPSSNEKLTLGNQSYPLYQLPCHLLMGVSNAEVCSCLQED